jgi:hypothetical protein
MMMRRLFCFLSVVFVYLMLCSSANCGDGSAQDQPQLFTNEDIKRYQTPSDASTVNEQPTVQESGKVSRKDKKQRNTKDKKQRDTEEHEMEYWCKKASVQKKKINKADEEVKRIEKELSAESKKSLQPGKNTSKLQKKLEKARKQHKEAEKDLADLENEAHRKWAKPGWLRCQI